MANPNPDSVIMNAIGYVILPGTRLASLGNPVVIENPYTLSTGRFPAVHIEAGRQKYATQSTDVYDGTVEIVITYFDRWDQATTPIDAIRQNIKSDLEIILDNLMSNSSLTVGTDFHAVSIGKFQLAPYKGELDNSTVQGMTLLKRALTISVNVLPFDA
jgi:hypothetical protein